jgi:hypothetical protein
VLVLRATIYTLSSSIPPLTYNRLGGPPCGSHYVKTSNRLRNICNGPLTHDTCTHICNDCYLTFVTDKRGRPTQGWPPQCLLPMWTLGNDLLKRLLNEFFVTDIK